jgi:hypothetical protein
MLELTTPALLFSTVSLTMLAYTNRFLALAKLIRDLHDQYSRQPEIGLFRQIYILKHRLNLVRQMQLLCILALASSMISMLFLLLENRMPAQICFGFSLILLILSLGFSVYEIYLSNHAINISLQGLDKRLPKFNPVNRILLRVERMGQKWLHRH